MKVTVFNPTKPDPRTTYECVDGAYTNFGSDTAVTIIRNDGSREKIEAPGVTIETVQRE